jgi:CRISPR/Cas system CSM-associated protein Csm3 (group 7 of RAMP superfamily)
MSRSVLWRKPREIVKRIVIKGDLVLQTAAHLGSGDNPLFGMVDLLLLRDPLENRPFLPGSSIAGALRNYLCEREFGFRQNDSNHSLAEKLFGMTKNNEADKDGLQSPLIVDDSLADAGTAIELRDGVQISPDTRTAKEGHKFDLEVLAAGTVFPLTFELLLEKNQLESLPNALALALQGLQNGEIGLGARKQRGLGQVKVSSWQVWEFDVTTPHGLLYWLEPSAASAPKTGPDIGTLLAAPVSSDAREYFKMGVTFALDGAMLIRSNFDYDKNGPDVVHLKTIQPDGSKKPIVPGSSFAGVIRHRALKIANTLNLPNGQILVNQMFGCSEKDPHCEDDTGKPIAKASRVRVSDAVIENTLSRVQNRIRIDRFTGGTHDTALFNEQPVFGRHNSTLNLSLTLLNPKDEEIGLLLQVLKDLWTGDLPIGGSSSVGRGYLRGIQADLFYKEKSREQEWSISQPQPDKPLQVTGNSRDALEKFAEALLKGASA